MLFRDLTVLFAVWTWSVGLGGWLMHGLREAGGQPKAFVRVLEAVLTLLALWLLYLTVAIVVQLVDRAAADPVVGWVLIITAGAITALGLGAALIRVRRRRLAEERSYLNLGDTNHVPRSNGRTGTAMSRRKAQE